MKKLYLIPVMVILVGVLLFSACSKTTTATAPTSTVTATATSTVTAAPTNQPTIKIGALFPTSGGFAGSMPWVLPALKMALDEANAAGGALGGRQFELVTRDSQGDPSVVAQRANELQAAGCVGIIGTLLDATDLALNDWAKTSHIPVILNSNSQELRTTGISDYSYYISPGSWAYANFFAKYIATQNVNSIYAINADLGFTHEFMDHFWPQMKSLKPGITDLGASYVGLMETDFSDVISAALAKNPDLIWAGEAGPPFTSFIQQCQQFGVLTKSKLAGAWMLGPDSTASFGLNYPKGILGVTLLPFYDASDQKLLDFGKAYLSASQTYPADITLEAYAGAKALAQAVKQANSTDPAQILSVLASVSVDTPVGPLSFTDYDHSMHFPMWGGASGYSPDYTIAIGVNLYKAADVYASKDEILAARTAK